MNVFELQDKYPKLFDCKTIDMSNTKINSFENSNINLSPMLLQLLTTDNRDSYKKLAVKIQERKPLKEWKTICKNKVITIK